MEKILVIGSGPIVIGQAAEFDYAGTQACKSLREEGYKVVLINSNPATIMTDEETADAVYIEPLNVDFCERVIARERPDGLLPTLGGQTGLNLATQLANQGILEKYGVKLLGTPLSAIQKAEDREEFRQLMREIKEPVPESWIIETPDQLEAILDVVPYPCIIRPAYTLGGTGGGIAYSREELLETGLKGLQLSMRSQLMVERSLLGWKEVEYEVMRDRKGNCITICNMENFDPMGVHTGDSIVIAPSQTLSDIEYHMLRTASLKIIRALGIEGGCNVQLAVNPHSFDYYVIEVNPRVSRSSALASKATGYPIARVSAKIAVGKTLDEIENQVTGTTKACFEPALDYCVVKIPRWPFDKFPNADRSLFTQMKATGEVMAIDRSFEAAFMKAIRGLEVKQKDLRHPKMQALEDKPLRTAISKPTDERLWAIAEGLRRGWGVDEVNRLSKVDKWFLMKISKLIDVEKRLDQVNPRNIHSSYFQSLISLANVAGLAEWDIATLSIEDLVDALKRNDTSPIQRMRIQQAIVASSANSQLVAQWVGIAEYDVLALRRLAITGTRDDVSKHFLDFIITDAIESAFMIGYPSNSIRDLVGVTKEAGHLAQEVLACWNSAKDSIGADSYEIADILRNSPYEGGHPEELAAFAALHTALAPKYFALASLLHWPDDFYIPVAEVAFIDEQIEKQKIMPVFKMVDTCAGEFESQTPYYYGTFEQEDDAKVSGATTR